MGATRRLGQARPDMTLQHIAQNHAVPHRLDPVEALRGNWLNRRRLFLALCIVLVLVLAACFGLYRDASPPYDGAGRLLGLDFSALWAAGAAGLSGDWVSSYHFPRFMEHMRTLFGERAEGLLWAYPPVFYFLVMPLALLPYGTALAVWLSVGFAAFAVVVRRILAIQGRDRFLVLLAIIAFPGSFGNAIHGQTGFLTAALFGGALVLLPARPVLAGVLFACLVYKPQYGLLIPLALAAGGHWRTFAAAAVTVLALVLATMLAFGPESWSAFFAGMQDMRTQSLDLGRNGYHNMQSAFAAVRLYGFTAQAAWAVQGLVALVLASGLVWIWRSRVDYGLKAASLLTASLAATPYCLDYDLVVLGPAIAFYVRFGLNGGFKPWEQSILALAFLMPPLARYFAFYLHLPMGAMAILGLFCLAFIRVGFERRHSSAVP